MARNLGVPVVAVYQTDLAGFAVRYGCSALQRPLWNWIRRVHGLAERTLAPSRDAVEQLIRHGIGGVHRWARGVDLTRFAPHRRSTALRAELAPNGELLVGYVGRLAAEKQVDLLACLGDLPGVQLVIVGEGPRRAALTRRLPRAHFLGLQHGSELAASLASLDVGWLLSRGLPWLVQHSGRIAPAVLSMATEAVRVQRQSPSARVLAIGQRRPGKQIGCLVAAGDGIATQPLPDRGVAGIGQGSSAPEVAWTAR